MLALILGNFWILVKGTAIGFAVAAPVGPIGMLCIRTTLERGRTAGFCAGLGAAVADSVFACFGALGISLVGAFLEHNAPWLELVGGLFLILFGAHLARRHPNPHAGDERAVPPGLWREFSVTLALTLANPTTILSFAGIFAGVSGLRAMGLALLPALIAGVFVGSAAWWLTLSFMVGALHHRISESAMIWINRLAGAALMGFGLFAFLEALRGPVAAMLGR